MSDGLYLGVGDGCHAVWGPIIAASRKEESAARRLCVAGEEWVELDDAGQPVEANPVRMWVVRKVAGGPYFSRRFSESGEGHRWITDASLARTWPTREACEGLCERDEVPVPVLVHPNGTVTLDEPAPAVAQLSPYSDSDDEPIPYKLTEPDKTKRDRLIAEIAVHYAKASRHVRMASKKSRKLERLDAKIDSAKARLRGGK